MKQIAILLLSFSIFSQLKADLKPTEQLDIYLLIGQSNMAGRAQITTETQDHLENCYLLNGNEQWEIAQAPLNKHSSIRKDLKMQRLNPGYAFAKSMLKHNPKQKIGLVVNAKGGSKIESWAKGTHFYNEAVRRTKEAMKRGQLKGILWHQGESNSNKAENYLPKLVSLINNLRLEFNQTELPFIAGQVFYHPTDKPHTKAINEVLASLPQKLKQTATISSEGTTTFDKTHFDTKSTLLLGSRYAENMITLLNKK